MSEEPESSAEPDAESAAAKSAALADDLDESLDPSASEPDPSFDVTTGDDLVDQLPSGSDVPTEVKREFWTAALLLKIAILALTGAALLAYFRGALVAAAVLAGVGLLAASRTLLKVRRFRRS